MTPPSDLETTFLKADGVTGKCYVLTFSPSHDVTLADLTPAEILPVVEAWTDIFTFHLPADSPLRLTAPAPGPGSV
ncbi:galactose-1-phosphate uridyl transferase, partial [Ascosphaera acerosa]